MEPVGPGPPPYMLDMCGANSQGLVWIPSFLSSILEPSGRWKMGFPKQGLAMNTAPALQRQGHRLSGGETC
jgi:hypothetical protein